MEERDFYAEYLQWYEGTWHAPDSRPLTKEEFYKNFPDCKPARKK